MFSNARYRCKPRRSSPAECLFSLTLANASPDSTRRAAYTRSVAVVTRGMEEGIIRFALVVSAVLVLVTDQWRNQQRRRIDSRKSLTFLQTE